jgi:hypothetical protein
VNRLLLAAMAAVTLFLLFPWRMPAGNGVGLPHPASGPGRPAPEFPTRDAGLWINSRPLSIADLRGMVVLIDVWTYG